MLVDLIVANKGTAPNHNLEDAYSLINSSTVVKIVMDSEMPQGSDCAIKFDSYLHDDESTQIELHEKS